MCLVRDGKITLLGTGQDPDLVNNTHCIQLLALVVLSGRAQAIQYLFIDNDIDYEWIKPPLPNQEEWLIKYKPMMVS